MPASTTDNYTVGAFHSTEIFGYFQEQPRPQGFSPPIFKGKALGTRLFQERITSQVKERILNSIFQNFQKQGYLTSYTQIFENLFPEAFFPFNFAPGNSRILGGMVRISEIQQLPEFLETFREISVPCRKFWLDGKRPVSTDQIYFVFVPLTANPEVISRCL